MSQHNGWITNVNIPEDRIYGFSLSGLRFGDWGDGLEDKPEPHPWKDDLRLLANMLHGTVKIPHSALECNDCRKACSMRVDYILQEGK